MKEEDLIRKQFGKANPFRVPEGYFEHLSEQIMDSLPAQDVVLPKKSSTLWYRLRPYSVAAAICAVVFGVGVIGLRMFENQPQFAEMQSATEEYTIDQVADFAMVDNVSMYSYILDESEDVH